MPSWTVYAAQAREAEKARKEARRFGWDDLFSLLNTAAGAYGTYQNVQAGKAAHELDVDKLEYNREVLGEDQRQFDVDELARQGGAMRDLGDKGFEQVEEPAFRGEWPEGAQAQMLADAVQEYGTEGTAFPDLGDTRWRQRPPAEYPEVPGQVHVGGGEYIRAYPEDAPEAWRDKADYYMGKGFGPTGTWAPSSKVGSGVTVEGVPGELTTSALSRHQQELMGYRDADLGVGGAKMMSNSLSQLFGYSGSSGEFMQEAFVTEGAQEGMNLLQSLNPALSAEVLNSPPERIQRIADEYAKNADHDPKVLAGLLYFVQLFGMGRQTPTAP